MRNTLFAAAITALLLTGCSSGAPASSQAPASSEPDSNVLRVGMECNYAPFNWTTTSTNEFTQPITSVDYADGYDVVIATRIAEELGREVQIVKTDWDNLIPALQHGTLDLVIAGMTDTPERRESVDFTDPYYSSEEVIIVRKDSELVNITDIQDLAGYAVRGQMNTIYDEIIDQINGVVHAEPKEDYPSMVFSLQQGEVDAITAELPVAIGVVNANSDLTYVTFADGHGFDADTTVSVALAKGNEDLVTEINAILAGISYDERQSIMGAAVDRQPSSEE